MIYQKYERKVDLLAQFDEALEAVQAKHKAHWYEVVDGPLFREVQLAIFRIVGYHIEQCATYVEWYHDTIMEL